MAVRLLKRVLRVPVVGPLLAPAWFDEGRLIVQQPIFDRLLSEHPLHGRVLNAGCGEGLYAPFVERFAGVGPIVNIDVHPPRVARMRGDARHRDAQGSLDALPFRDGAFDAIVCTEVLEHVADDRRAVSELARVLRSGGVLLMSVPTPPAPFDPAHVREGYRRAELAALLSEAGFEIRSTAACLHGVMRATFSAWQRQQHVLGRNAFPRVLLRSAAWIDRLAPIGAPWDVAVVAVRCGA